MKADYTHQPRRVDLQQAISLKQEIELFNAEYCSVLDRGDLLQWPEFFAEDALYRVTAKENAARGLPVGLVYCEGRDMIADRALAILKAMMFAPRDNLHVLGPTRIVAVDGALIEAETTFMLLQTLVEGPTTIHLAGVYFDVFTRAKEELKLKERQVVYDTALLANDVVHPV